ncbi:ATPase inhibitor mai-2, mitochondrial-like [Tachypleus tridentatus]|uniref:ATPase inhibitor mai-2, mitochondrial-like n=1 Tax=Tachypleus tridentatus TaxID=6853 RepID=UPI003FD0F56F
MALQLKFLNSNFSRTLFILRHMSSGEWGTGAGKGGGSGGAVRDAGGSFGKMEAAREEEYFRKLQHKQLSQLKSHLHEEIEHHKQLIKQHEREVERHKERIEELKRQEKETQKKD